jgi:hypothetical protein
MLSYQILFSRLEHTLKNGLECLKEIRNNEKFKEILIAIYSTSGQKIFMKHLLRQMYTLRSPNNFELLKKTLSKAIDTSCISKEASLDRKTFSLY